MVLSGANDNYSHMKSMSSGEMDATLISVGGRWKPVLFCHLLDGRKRVGAEQRSAAPLNSERLLCVLSIGQRPRLREIQRPP